MDLYVIQIRFIAKLLARQIMQVVIDNNWRVNSIASWPFLQEVDKSTLGDERCKIDHNETITLHVQERCKFTIIMSISCQRLSFY